MAYIDDLSLQQITLARLLEEYPNGLIASNLEEPTDEGWDWSYLSQNQSLSLEVIDKYWGKWDIGKLSKNPCLTPEIVDKYRQELNVRNFWLNSSIISRLEYAHYGIMRDNDGDVNPYLCYSSDNPHLTPEIIEKCWGQWDIEILSFNPALTPELIEKYWGQWDIDSLSGNPSLSPELIKRHWEEWDIDALSANPALTSELIQSKTIMKLKCSEEYEIDYHSVLNSYCLSSNNNLTPEIIENHWGLWDMRRLSSNPALTRELIEKYWEGPDINTKIDKSTVIYNPNFSVDMKIEKLDQLDIAKLSYDNSLPYTVIIDNPHLGWNIKGLSKRTYMPVNRWRMTKRAA